MRKLRWKLKNRFWNWFIVQKFRFNEPRRVPKPRDSARKIRRIPLSQRYPSIPVSNILVANYVPADESKFIGRVAVWIQARFYRHFPPKEPGLPSIDPDPIAAVDLAYGQRHREYFRAPVIPKEYQGPIDLGSLAVAGPYSCYLQHVDGGGYEWDLRHLDCYECHPGLRRLGVRVLFEVNQVARCLKTVEIDCELGLCKPGDSEWELAQQIALCAATTQVSLVRHFIGTHLALVAQFAIATRNTLPANHCVRRLLWPHVWGTQYSNELVTEISMMKGGDFEEIFSFSYDGLCKLLANSYDQYDICVIDPLTDADRRGILKGGFDLPALDNRLAHWDVMHAHACRYLCLYYGCDQDLRDDAAIRAWVKELNRLVPNGVNRLLGDKLTIDGAAKLIAAYIYAGTVEHEVLGSALWDYQLWTHVQPVRVYKNGRREPIDVYQRLVNYNFSANVRRAPLLQDFSYLAGNDDAGAAAFSTFLAELTELQLRLKKEPHDCWKIYPADLEVSVNG
ncbi:MAG: lipoxygenase family protein [Pseudonocardiaceae bacterium]